MGNGKQLAYGKHNMIHLIAPLKLTELIYLICLTRKLKQKTAGFPVSYLPYRHDKWYKPSLLLTLHEMLLATLAVHHHFYAKDE